MDHQHQHTMENIERNKVHYDNLYSSIEVSKIVEKIRNFDLFFDDALKTDTSWLGMYYGGFANRLRGKKVLEIGCGDGLNALVMAYLGANVVAIDISKESGRVINKAIEELRMTEVQAITGDFADVPFEKHSFDFIVGKNLLHHLTHEQEEIHLRKVATLLAPDGEARFFEPATNSKLLDNLRWMIPVPGRPSKLRKKAFAKWRREKDPHPMRDNSSSHFVDVGLRFFNGISITCIGSIERFERLIPVGKLNRRFRRWAHRVNDKLPMSIRNTTARSQLIVMRDVKG